jgi:glycosyltransferase involved in cell wall biosynthesis
MANSRTAKSSPQLISVVIPVCNAASTLSEQLDALTSQTYVGAWEVIVADNGSMDGSQEIVGRWRGRLPGLQLVDASERRGANYARNVGARAARGDFLVFCDADDVATPEWLTGMAKAAEESDLVGGALDPEALNGKGFVVGKHALPVAHDFLPFAFSANIGVWASVFEDIGGWNEQFLHGGDDVEFCWKAQLAAYQLRFAPNAVMKYRFRSGLREHARQAYEFGVSNPALYLAFRERGMPRSSTFGALKNWLWLLLHLPWTMNTGHRRRWIRDAARRWGRLVGSIRFRVLFL